MSIIISRAVAPPCARTFTIKPIREFVMRYVGNGEGWIDPFAGANSPAEFTNDLDPAQPSQCHMEAAEFCNFLPGPFVGVIVDPPYSKRQISEHYKAIGQKATYLDTSDQFYNRVRNAICDKIIHGGYALSFGWDSNGFGKNRGFEIIEILLVAHRSHHNDTICVAERKIS